MTSVLALQHSVGNHVVQRFLSGPGASTEAPAPATGTPLGPQLERRAGGGGGLDGRLRDDLESSFGASLARMRIHTGAEATQMARSVGAVAFTYGQDVYFRDGAYDPGSSGGRELIAHEAAHTLQQASGAVPGVARKPDGVSVSTPGDRYERAADAAARAFTSGDRVTARMSLEGTAKGIQRVTDEDLAMRAEGGGGASKTGGGAGAARSLTWMTMKRKHIELTGTDKYGHWWTEMDGSESYGWWPKYPVGLWDTLVGIEGELNGQTSFGGTATTDPHHGDSAPDTFNPEYSGSLTDSQVKDEVRKYARSYSGEWRWTFGWGQNCHTFQKSMMAHVGLREP